VTHHTEFGHTRRLGNASASGQSLGICLEYVTAMGAEYFKMAKFLSLEI
jgi:hypothetical protein